jgi:hypothetical protein
MRDGPSDGDVLITIEAGRYLLSIVPHPHKLSLSHFDAAVEIAKRWAREHEVTVWRVEDTPIPLNLD